MSAVKSVETDNVGKPTACLGVRHAQAALLFLAMLLAYSMRVNISMAIVAMTDPASEDSFSWSVQKQSVILSSFFWGYVVLQVPAGEVAARWGGKLPVALVVGVNSLVCLVLPLAAYYGGWAAVCACRVVQGLFQGLLFPSTHSLMSKWIPLEEKSRLGTIIYAGAHIGTGLQLMAAGFTASYLGWAAIFYINGSLGAAWTALYLLYGAASPDDSRSISEEERNYIQNSLGQVKGEKKVPTPWRSILTSLPFWALLVVHCGQNWGFWTLMTEMPSYMSQVLGVNIKANGVMSALPYLAMYLMSLPFGFLSDHILARGWLSVSVTRKLFNTIGLWGPALALIGLSYAPAGDVTVAVACLTVTVALNAGHIMGFLLVHLDLAPRHAGSLMGVTNCVSNIVSIVAPLAAGAILQDETDPADWRKVFYLASLVYLLSNGFFLIFGTSERQRWNDPPTQDHNETSTQHASGKVV